MANPNNLSIEFLKQGFTLKVEQATEITDKALLDILGDKGIAILQGLQLLKEREKYDKLKPIGFEHASKKAKKYRKKLEETGDIEQMEELQKILVYNEDNTIFLPTIKETFCIDLTLGERVTRREAEDYAKSEGYNLLSDWNDSDNDSQKQSTDWYRLENLFGKHADQGALFSMLGFKRSRYWTNTYYKNEKGLVIGNLVRGRSIKEYKDSREFCFIGVGSSGNVCGFMQKPM